MSRLWIAVVLMTACSKPASSDQPTELVSFFQIRSGQRIGQLDAGDGAFTRVLSQAVGPEGKVYAQGVTNDKLRELSNVVIVDAPLDGAFPPDVRDLDAVIAIGVYHRAVNSRLNDAVYAVLRPGGTYGVVDNSAEAKTGDRDVQTLHRIDEEQVRMQLEVVGFRFDDSSDILRDPDDQRNNDAEKHPGDRFVLRFKKPPPS